MPTTTATQPTGAAFDARFRGVVADLDALGLDEMQSTCRRWRSILDSAEARRLAAEMRPGEDERPTRRKAASGGSRSRRSAAKAAKRAAAIKKNPRLADDMDSGKLSTEQTDTIADAASKSDGEAARDQGLIDAVAAAGVDAGRKIASEWLQKRADKDRVESKYQRQQRRRRMSTYTDPHRDTDVIKLEGPTSRIAELKAQIELRERQLWETDGGRERKSGEHKRTREQRLFDAACDIILGRGATKTGGGRPAAVITINGDDPSEAAEMVGVGPIPDSVAAEILSRANIFVSISDLAGKNLWWGRLKRTATTTQFITLAARDKGCVLCGAHWLRCEVHHVMPWNSPAKGETNIDELVLVCSSCHHDTHATNLTIIRRPDGTSATRPARPEEVAPTRPDKNRPKRSARFSVLTTDEPDRAAAPISTPVKQPERNDSSDDEAA